MSRIRVMQMIEDVGAPGGAEKVAYDLAAGLDPSRFESVVAVVEQGTLADYYRPIGVPVEILPGYGRTYRTLSAIRDAVRKHKIDILHSHLMKMNTFNGLSGALSRWRRVCSIHGLLPHEVTPAARRYGWLASRMTNKTVVVSDSLARAVVEAYHVSPDRLVTIPNGFDSSRIDKKASPSAVSEFRARHDLAEGTPTIVAIGNVREVKGYDYLLMAMAELKRDIPDVRLFVAGYDRLVGPLGLEKLRRELDLTATATFLGHFADIATLFTVSSVYVCSSVHEGFSITTIEALAWGLPVVVTDCGGPTEIIGRGEAGILVPPADPSALAHGLKTALVDKNQAACLAEKGKARARGHYSMQQFLEKHQQLYLALVS